MVTPDLVVHMPGSPDPVSRAAMLQGISAFNAAFSQRHFTIDDVIAEGNRVATRTTMRATHSGDYQGYPATGRQIEVSGLSLERIKMAKLLNAGSNMTRWN